jgi:hypothetical protein
VKEDLLDPERLWWPPRLWFGWPFLAPPLAFFPWKRNATWLPSKPSPKGLTRVASPTPLKKKKKLESSKEHTKNLMESSSSSQKKPKETHHKFIPKE